MKAVLAIIRRDMTLAVRQGGGAGTAIGFFLIVVSLLPLGIGPDLNLLTRIAPGALWVALLLAVLLSAERIFQPDYEDGSLEVLLASPVPLEIVALAKALAHWLTTGLPLTLALPFLGILLNIDIADIGPIMLAALLGTPALSLIAAFGTALTMGVRRGGLLVSLLVLPLYVPALIFGVVLSSGAMRSGPGYAPPALILAAITLGAVVLAPIGAAAAIRAHMK